jgi:glutamate 5-kinase
MSLYEKRIVVKVGTSTLTHENGSPNLKYFNRLARVLVDVHNAGYDVIVVSSGAIAVGAKKLRMEEKPSELRLKQAAAAVGQSELMHTYGEYFGDYGTTVGQILLTGDDMYREAVRENLINTFDSLLELGCIPIVNENDSVSFEEIESEHKVFGDNDTLSAHVAVLCRASCLILLSDTEGLYDSDPHINPDAKLIEHISEITDDVLSLAGGAGTKLGTGGMVTKLSAAKLALEEGISMVITNGEYPERIYDILDGHRIGTLFMREEG